MNQVRRGIAAFRFTLFTINHTLMFPIRVTGMYMMIPWLGSDVQYVRIDRISCGNDTVTVSKVAIRHLEAACGLMDSELGFIARKVVL